MGYDAWFRVWGPITGMAAEWGSCKDRKRGGDRTDDIKRFGGAYYPPIVDQVNYGKRVFHLRVREQPRTMMATEINILVF